MQFHFTFSFNKFEYFSELSNFTKKKKKKKKNTMLLRFDMHESSLQTPHLPPQIWVSVRLHRTHRWLQQAEVPASLHR